MALLKGKTVHRTPPVVVQDIMEVPKEIRENHKRVTLTIDIFCQQGSILCHSQFADSLSFSDTHDQPKNSYNLQSSEGYAQFLSPERVSDCVYQRRW